MAHDREISGNKLQAFLAELFDVGAKWKDLKCEDEKEIQDPAGDEVFVALQFS